MLPGYLINRPCLDGAVLQTALVLSHLLTVPPNSLKFSTTKRFRKETGTLSDCSPCNKNVIQKYFKVAILV